MAHGSKFSRPVVLVVDDERSFRNALSHELAVEFEVIAVPGIEEAFEILGKRSDFVAVITDLMMREPDDGYALLEAVRLLHPHCARILVSATSEGDWYIKNGTAHRFIGKPWKKGAVLASIWELVG